MGYIPEEIIDEVLQKTDIVSVISEYVSLKKRGRYYFGICPFHQESTPSFSVTPDKQIFYCFGCHVGGNVFKFLMLKEGVSFVEAVHLAARRCGVHIPEKQFNSALSRDYQKKQRAYYVLEKAADFFRKCLEADCGKEARDYLKKRGVNEQAIKLFKIGYAPDNWDKLIKYLTKLYGIGVDEIYDVGLVVKSKAKYYDRFRNRIIMPIFDVLDRVVGFGGRALGDSLPKYLNTPETKYFNKRHLLYGLNLAKPHIREEGFVFVVEGYMDVIACYQFGIKNVVASLGTALTLEQVKLLMRYTDEIVIAYDADDAGIKAAMRGLDLIQQLGCRVKILSIPDKMDPDEHIRRYGREGWQELLKTAKDLIEFKLEKLTDNTSVSVEEKVFVLKNIVPNLSAIKNLVELEESIKKVASALNVSVDSVKGELSTYKKEVKTKDKIKPKLESKKVKINPNSAEHLLLSLVLSDYDLYLLAKKEITPEIFDNEGYGNIFKLLIETEYKLKLKPAKEMCHLNEKEQKLLTYLLSEQQHHERSLEEKMNMLKDCISIIYESHKKRKHQELVNKLKEAEEEKDYKRVNNLLYELQQLFSSEKGGKLFYGRAEK
ncbi:MAG: DNA primase [Desulfotomaculum sp.]|nr:DNA primase [Desulfotomaculum sp.]